MKYELSIREHNQQAHIDIEQEIQDKRNGLFTCIIRVNNGNIVDVVFMEYEDFKDYYSLKSITIEKLSFTYHPGTDGEQDTLRTNNG